jgi:uncharacterized membrane protein YgaE (UPF0421/DUF939 family)
MNRRIWAQEAFKLALSMTLMFWLALWMNWDMPGNGGLAIILVSLGSTGASLQKGVMRIASTTVGLLVAFLAIALFSQDRWLTLVFFSLYLLTVSYLIQWSQYGYAWYVAGFLPLTVWATTYMQPNMGYEAFHYGTFRYLETTSGIIIYTLVCALIWPKRAGDQLKRQGKGLWPQFRQLFSTYRGKLENGELNPQTEKLQMGLAGSLSQMLATLQAAYSDTSSIRDQKRVWEVMRVNVRALADVLELWQQSIDDCRHLNPEEIFPGLHNGLDVMDKRFERIENLWQAKPIWNEPLESDEDADLLKPLAMDVRKVPSAELSHFDRAALMTFVQQVKILDLATRELFRTMRVLAGLDSVSEFRVRSLPPDLYRPSGWDPQRLFKALFPPFCFVVAYFFWIYVNPPGGAQIPSMVATISLCFMMNPLNPIAMLKVLLVVMWVVVAPIYFFVMPALDTGFGLLSLIFTYTFVFGYLGGRAPALKLIPVLLFVNMTGISNNQTYSFMGLMTAGMVLLLVMCIIAAIYMLWTPSRPERVLLASVRRFFKGCYGITGAFAFRSPKERERNRKLRKRYFESMLLPASRQLRAARKNLNYKLFPENDVGKVNLLETALQEIVYRFQALEIAYDRVAGHYPDLLEPLSPLRKEMRESVQRVFKSWARFKQTDALEDERAAIREMARALERALDAHEEDNTDLTDGKGPEVLYALMGTVRGLLQAMVETQKAVGQINWGQWAAARF